MATHSIVVAEDDADLRRLYERKFTREGYDVRTARNGEEALSLVVSAAPHLLILDLAMPMLDGFGVLERLPPDRRSFPILVLTDFNDPATRRRVSALGADEFLGKLDVHLDALLRSVDRLLACRPR